jgi:hypothetical protein
MQICEFCYTDHNAYLRAEAVARVDQFQGGEPSPRCRSGRAQSVR